MASSNSLFFDNKFFKLTSGSNSMGAPLRCLDHPSHYLSNFGEGRSFTMGVIPDAKCFRARLWSWGRVSD